MGTGDGGFCRDTRSLSPVIGVVLMVGVAVALAAVVATMVFGFGERLEEPAYNAPFEKEFHETGEGNTNDRPYFNLTNQAGEIIDSEQIVIKDESGNSVTWNDVWSGGTEVKAGETVRIDGIGSDGALDQPCSAGQTYTIVYKNDDGSNGLVTQYELPRDPNVDNPSIDGDGDGIPNWC